MEISPSTVAAVCQAGDQLELIYNTTGPELSWEFTAISESGSAMTYMPAPVESAGPSGVPPSVIINTTTFTFSRLSYRDSLPLISRMTISPASSGLNGTVVNCFEGFPSTESAATTIRIIDPGQFGKKIIYGMHSGYLGEEGRVIILSNHQTV